MNAQSVWPGHEYAYVTYVRKKHFPMNASRVKVLSLRKVKEWGNERDSTMATVTFVDSELTREVNVRNLHDFWDSYIDEREGRLAEKRREEEEAQERLRKQREEQEKLRVKEQTIGERLAWRLGLDTSVVRVNPYAHEVTIQIKELEFLLND